MNEKDEKEKRRKANKDILERFKRGETLSSVPPEATWFPPRPKIIKDLSKLYGLTEEEKVKRVKARLSIVKEEDGENDNEN